MGEWVVALVHHKRKDIDATSVCSGKVTDKALTRFHVVNVGPAGHIFVNVWRLFFTFAAHKGE